MNKSTLVSQVVKMTGFPKRVVEAIYGKVPDHRGIDVANYMTNNRIDMETAVQLVNSEEC